jgi:HTH-type transcriptional regulator / antitoxin HigA
LRTTGDRSVPNLTDFKPNWQSAPGETIADILEQREMPIGDFANRMGCNVKRAEELLAGHVLITSQIAERLSQVVGATREFWLKRESQFREDEDRLKSRSEAAPSRAWLNQLPLSDMKKQGWIESSPRSGGDLQACLDFFDVPSIPAWHREYKRILKMAAFRTSSAFAAESGPVAAWLRQGEILSSSILCAAWDPKRFRDALKSIRALTRKHDPEVFVPALQELCAECGVAVVILRAPTGCRASGATRFVSPQKALLLLSFRYRTDDHFWFTFFHEAAHLLLHGKTAIFVEDGDMVSTHEEEEANDFAAKYLIPQRFHEELMSLRPRMKDVVAFAFRLKISPGIVVGQMQHLKRIKPNQLTFLKRRYEWV